MLTRATRAAQTTRCRQSVKRWSFKCTPAVLHKGHNHGGGASHADSLLNLNEQARKDCDRVTKIGMVANCGLVLAKGVAGVVGNSTALIADAAHSLSDLASDVITLATVQQVRKPHSDKHPYGYGKYESLGSLGVSGMLLVTGAGIMWSSVSNLLKLLPGGLSGSIDKLSEFFGEHHHHLELDTLQAGPPGLIALAAAVASIIIKEWTYQITVVVGRKHNSNVVIANAWHHRSDAFSSVVAVAGVGAAIMFDISWMDSVAGAIVGGMVTKTAWDIGKDSIDELVDKQVQGPFKEAVGETISHVSGVIGYHQLRIRKMGPFYALDVHIVVDRLVSVSAAFQIAERVRHELRLAHKDLTDVLVHVDPYEGGELHHDHSHDVHPENQHDHAEVSKEVVHQTNENIHLQRPQEQIKKDVEAIVQRDFAGRIQNITHFTCHYHMGTLDLLIDVTMNHNLTIDQATRIGEELRVAIISQIPDVREVDVHLDLLDYI